MEAAAECISTKPKAKCKAYWESQAVRKKKKKKEDNLKKHPYSKKGTQQMPTCKNLKPREKKKNNIYLI